MTDETPIVPADATNQSQKAESAPQQASPAAAPVFPAQETGGDEKQADIARILQGIKLPERRSFKATADASAQKPQTPESEASILEERIVKAAGPSTQQGTQPVGDSPAPTESSPETPEGGTDSVSGESAHEAASSVVIPMRTLKDDLQTIVREKKISLVRAVSLEEEKKKGQEHLVPEQKEIRARQARRTTGILFASFLFIILGFGALFGVFYVMQKQQSPSQATANFTILFAEQSKSLPLGNTTSQDLKNELEAFSSKPPGPLGSITRIVPTVADASAPSGTIRPATLAEFFNALDIHPPQDLMNAIGPDFFFGIHVVDKNAPVFVIPVRSYDHAFAGMLAWEASMNGDLSPIFTPVPMTRYEGTSTVPIARTFQDIVLRNYDTRALEDDSGAIQLYYSFPTPTILVIAESPYTFPEILSRLQAQREL